MVKIMKLRIKVTMPNPTKRHNYYTYNYMGYIIINMYEGVCIYIFINIITLPYLIVRG